MQQDAAIARVKETFEDWSLYDAVIQHDYMCHRELASALKIVAAEVGGGLRIVDLGCGDAWLASHAFQDVPIEQYLGVDLSEGAVERARSNVAIWESRATVMCGNIAEFITTLADGTASLILASNSLHHFGSDRKTEIVRHCFRVLAPKGVLCWIDPVRNEDESRDDYLRRLTNVMQHDWIGLSEDQRRRAIQHVWESDYPETASGMRQCADQAGFRFGGRFLEGELFGAWRFVRP